MLYVFYKMRVYILYYNILGYVHISQPIMVYLNK